MLLRDLRLLGRDLPLTAVRHLHRYLVLMGWLAATGCGPALEVPGPVPITPETLVATPSETSETITTSGPRSNVDLPPNELLAVGTAMSDVVMAVLEERALPDIGVPYPAEVPMERRLQLKQGAERPPTDLRFVFFGAMLMIGIEDASGQSGRLRVGVISTPNGVRALRIDLRMHPPPGLLQMPAPLPSGLASLRPVAQLVTDAVSAGAVEGLMFREEDVASILDRATTEFLMRERREVDLGGVSGTLSVTGITPDEMILAARSGDGRMHYFELEIDPVRGAGVGAANGWEFDLPLVEVFPPPEGN